MTDELIAASDLPREEKAEFERLLITLGKQYGQMPVTLAAQFTNISTCIGKLAYRKDLPDDEREQARRIAGCSLAMLITICNSALRISDESVMRCIDSIRELNFLITDDLSGLHGGKTLREVAEAAIRDAASRG